MLNHDEALALANTRRLESNLARCYLALHDRLHELEPTYHCPICHCTLDVQFKEIPPPSPVWPKLEKFR